MNICNKLCCKSNLILIQLYIDKKWSVKRIGDFCGSSHPHISMRLRKLGIEMRKREDYPPSRGGRKPRVHFMWKISEKELRETPMRVFKERFKLSNSEWIYAYKIKRRRLKEIANSNTEVNQKAAT